MITVLKTAVEAAKWQTRPSPGPQAKVTSGVVRGRGVATSLRGGTYNAAVAEVEVDRESGKIRVDHVTVTQDNGMTINPRALKLGIEANIVQTVSRALIEEVTFDRSNVTSSRLGRLPDHPLHGSAERRRDPDRTARHARHRLRRAVLQPDRPCHRERGLRRHRRPPTQPADVARSSQSRSRRGVIMQYAIRKRAKVAREVCALEAADAAFVSGRLRRDRLAALSVSWLRGLFRRQAPLVRSSRRNGVRAPLPRTFWGDLPWHYVRSPLSDDRLGFGAGLCSFRSDGRRRSPADPRRLAGP